MDGQAFLRDNKISIKSDHPIPNKSELYENLATLYRQDKTKFILFIPRHVFYYQYQNSLAKNPDRKKWTPDRLNKNKPIILDSLQAQQTSTDFEKYLALRGYRSSLVSYKTKTYDKEATVYYKVDPGPRMYIDTFLILAKDSMLQQIIDESPEKTMIPPGSPLDIQLYNQEKQRVVKILQNEGYATIDETYVSQLEVDTSRNSVKAIMRLLNPSDSTFHQVYYVGDVNVYPDYDIVKSTHYHDTLYNNIQYHLPDTPLFTLKPEVIDRNVFTRPGELTKRENYLRTIKNLGRIELIKFVTPLAEVDTTNLYTPVIDYTYQLTRNKKIPFLANAELTYSTIAAKERRSLAGMNFNVNYRDRNTYRGAEVLNVNLETGFEFNFKNTAGTSSSGLLNTLNIGVGTNLSFPRFMDPLRMYHLIGYTKREDRKALFGNRLRKMLIEDASTRLSLGYNYVTIRDLYEYHAFNASQSYDVQPDPYRKLTIDRFGFDLFVPDAKPDFQEILDNNPFQAASFGKQLFTGFLFRNYLFEINSKSKAKTGYFKFLHSVELSGLEMLLLNSLVSNDKEFVLGSKNRPDEGIRFSHFVKGEVDLRYYRDITRNIQFAFKFNTGVATPLWKYTDQVPFVKQFFVGGALSNRAWQIRELGPGGFEDTSEINPNLPFYQTGDMKLDMSAELRFHLFWYFKGAVFIDAANVWTLKKDDTRDEANFQLKDFYKELGIGYGVGLRIDVGFFILRLDLGYKLHNPYPVEIKGSDPLKKSRWLINELKRFPAGAEPQIAVGLPF
jgi:outer membrane protein insertion porin family